MNYLRHFIIIFMIINLNSSFAQDEDLQIKIAKNLRCLICQGQSIHDSDSEFANSVKYLIKAKLKSGENEKQIYDFLKNKYGEWILYDPSFTKNTYLLWLLPVLMFVLGGAIIFKVFIIKKN